MWKFTSFNHFYIPLRCIPLLLSKLCWGIFSKTYPSFLTLKEGVFSKITPSLFVDKASCTRQFESVLSMHSLASLFPIKEGSTSHLGLLPSGKKRKTALLDAQNRYAIRLADQSKVSPHCAGWDRLNHYLSFYPIVLMKGKYPLNAVLHISK